MLPWMFQILVKASFGYFPQEIITLLCAIMYVYYGELINMGYQHISWGKLERYLWTLAVNILNPVVDTAAR